MMTLILPPQTNKIGAVILALCGLGTLLLTVMIGGSVLEEAGILPRFVLRPSVKYTPGVAIFMSAASVGFCVCTVLAFWQAWKDWRGSR